MQGVYILHLPNKHGNCNHLMLTIGAIAEQTLIVDSVDSSFNDPCHITISTKPKL